MSETKARDIGETANGTILVGIADAIRRSTNNGDSFTSVQSISRNVWDLGEADDGTLIVVMGDEDAYNVGFYRSTDGGSSWVSSTPLDGCQWVGAGRHPRGSKYLLGGDQAASSGYVADITDHRISTLSRGRHSNPRRLQLREQHWHRIQDLRLRPRHRFQQETEGLDQLPD